MQMNVGGFLHPQIMVDLIPDGPWAGFERERAFEWSTHFYDSPPSFPGASIMALSYRSHLVDGFVGLGAWAETARQAETLGFSPATYSLLAHRLVRTSEARRPIDLERWAPWPDFVNSGHRPSHATELVLRKLAE